MNADTATADQPPAKEEQSLTPAPPPAAAAPPLPSVPPQREFSRVTMEHLTQLPDDEHRRNWINALVEAEVARQNYAYDRSLAREFAVSGQFEDIKGSTMEQAIATAMVKIQLGRSWGFNAADSMRYIYFTNGKPAIENEIVAAKLQQAGYGWDPEWIEEKAEHKGKPWMKCVGCTLWLKKWHEGERAYLPVLDRQGNPVSVSFTEADADHAMIWEKGKQIPLSQKWNFVSWARDMYYWRAVSRVKKYHAPHVLRGSWLRDEAIEVIPGDSPPEMLPPPPPDSSAPPEAADQQPPRLRDKVISQARQTSFTEPETPPPGEGGDAVRTR